MTGVTTRTATPQVKICGLTNLPDALAALEAGAAYLGFIFYEKSPRCVTPDQAQAIIEQLPPERRVRTVGVFVDQPLESIYSIRQQCGLDLIQLHGSESPLMIKAIGGAYKALRPATLAEWEHSAKLYLPTRPKIGQASADNADNTDNPESSGIASRMLPDTLPDILIDAYHPTQQGGTGLSVNREIALAARAASDRLMLAGGLTPDNVAEAISIVQPFAVDVSSGVESAPGKKDHSKIHAFVQAAKT